MNAPAGDEPHLLVVDDDERLRALLQRYLSSNGYRVTAATGAAQARALMKSMEFDLLILDVMMPGESGLELTKSVRTQSSVPILMLTARGDPADRIAGLELGADDYLPKPFEPSELLARMRAVLRRVAGRRLSASEALTLGPLRLVPMQREAWLRDQRLDLTEMEYDILELLARAAGRAVTRDELFGALYHRQRSPVERTIDVHVSNLRRKLGEDAGGAIQAVRGVGYRMRPSER